MGKKYSNFRKGVYSPINKEKVLNKEPIIYRSQLEFEWMIKFDKNPNVKKWGSEIIEIPYIKPTTKRMHRYYPDLYVEKVNGEKSLIEIKPQKEINLVKRLFEGKNIPKRTAKEKKATYEYKMTMGLINLEKWKACKHVCEKNGWKFLTISEKNL